MILLWHLLFIWCNSNNSKLQVENFSKLICMTHVSIINWINFLWRDFFLHNMLIICFLFLLNITRNKMCQCDSIYEAHPRMNKGRVVNIKLTFGI
jgi:hypothetical protein